MGVSKFPKFRLSQLWGYITLCVDLRLRWVLKQSYSLCWDIFNRMSHATFKQGNRVDSWLLVVGSQTANLTPDLSFGHNLCFKCPNGSCEPILDIYALIAFQWYKELFDPLGFNPCNRSLKIWESTGILNSQSGNSLGSVRFIPSHFPSLPGFLLAHNLTSPCLGCEPKVKVVPKSLHFL
jgi:hypothetical protein